MPFSVWMPDWLVMAVSILNARLPFNTPLEQPAGSTGCIYDLLITSRPQVSGTLDSPTTVHLLPSFVEHNWEAVST